MGPDKFTLATLINSSRVALYSIATKEAPISKEYKEIVYSLDWYPGASEQALLVSVKDRPLKLLNSDLSTRFTYTTKNYADEPFGPKLAKFNQDATEIYCGDNKRLLILNILGQQVHDLKIGGLVSDIDFNKDHSGLYAVGCFNGSIALLDSRSQQFYHEFQSLNGLTNSKFSQDGLYLISSHRNNDEMIVWDIRNSGNVLHKLKRRSKTNQRMHINIYGDYLYTGNTIGTVSCFKISTGDFVFEKLVGQRPVAEALMSQKTMITCSGARKFGENVEDGKLIVWDLG